MLNRFLRTASTRRLLSTLAGVVVVIAGGAAIAVAATGGGPVPKAKPLAVALHQALSAKPVRGISADVSFTNRLIDTSEVQGSDPLLQGGSGHIWVANDGRVRLELYGDNGDPEIVVTRSSWWVYDPMLQTVYQGALPSQRGGTSKASKQHHALPSIAQIQTEINQLAAHLNISGAIPSDVGGQPAYTVKFAPVHSSGLLGQLQLAWDALKGVPLRFALYRRGDGTPVVELAATSVSYGPIAGNTFNLRPPAGSHVVKMATPASGSAGNGSGATRKGAKKHSEVSGVQAVAKQLSFKLSAPSSLGGFARQSVSLLDSGTGHGALVVYGRYLGGVAVLEEPANPNGTQTVNLSTGSGDHARGITLPTVKVNGASGQELDTALGTIVRFTRGNVTYTVIGFVSPSVADAAARGL